MSGVPPPQARGSGPPQQPLQMTQITQHPITGQLQFTKQQLSSNGQLQPVQSIQRQEIANTVFRPGWNQPTMTLAELGERERAEAIQRSEAQKACRGPKRSSNPKDTTSSSGMGWRTMMSLLRRRPSWIGSGMIGRRKIQGAVGIRWGRGGIETFNRDK